MIHLTIFFSILPIINKQVGWLAQRLL